MIQERYKAEGSDKHFNNIMDAVYEALDLSRRKITQGDIDSVGFIGHEVGVIREVKYTGSNDWKSYTMNKVTFPAVKTSVQVS